MGASHEARQMARLHKLHHGGVEVEGWEIDQLFL